MIKYKDVVNERINAILILAIQEKFVKNKKELADVMGISTSKYSEIQSSRMRAGMEEIHKLCTFLNLSYEFVFDGQPLDFNTNFKKYASKGYEKNVHLNVHPNVHLSQNSKHLEQKRSVGETCLNSSDLSPPKDELYTELKQQVKDRDNIIAAQQSEIETLKKFNNWLEQKAQAQDNSEERKAI